MAWHVMTVASHAVRMAWLAATVASQATRMAWHVMTVAFHAARKAWEATPSASQATLSAGPDRATASAVGHPRTHACAPGTLGVMLSHPDRGSRSAYDRYLAGMDASMKQKVALTAAHLLCRGRIADMGMGSGAGSHALAALYPQLEVVGVDVDANMVALARERYVLPNLSFVTGDVAQPVFPEASLDGVFDSSVLHHVTTFGGYDHENATRALAVQARALKEHGVLVVRDFVEPPSAADVLLDLPSDDGADDPAAEPARASSAALFERFAREFRSLHATPGFRFEAAPAPRAGWKRYRVAHKLAAEFLLRKDYRADWVAEVKEEYGYFTQARFEEVFAGLGLRVLASTPIRNPWIVRHRFDGKCALHDLAGRPLEVPATNVVVVGERVPAGEGVRFREAGAAEPLGWLEASCWSDARGGPVRDLVRRPNLTVDVVPHFDAYGETFVVARTSYPRPVLGADTALDEARAVAYVAEPLVVVQADKPVAQTVEEALSTAARVASEAVRRFRPGGTYYPSPGGLQEEVRAMLVEIDPLFVEERGANASGWSTAGRVRAIEAQQVLRAAQVGGLPDARLELNVYELLLQLGRTAGPWIGEAIALREGPAPAAATTMAELDARPRRRVFTRAPREASTGFLELRCTRYEELDARGEVVASQALEHVVPRPLSARTVVAAPLRLHGGAAWIGLDDDDLPAAQCFEGHSELLVAPAWRLPRTIASMTPARAWVRDRLEAEYGAKTGDAWELGGRWHPSPGATAEVVHAIALEVTEETAAPRRLRWVQLADAVAHRAAIRDGHLRTVTLRAAHGLGVIG
jgi:ubiquinone/menaquinone biosynthesis C-methylase UbiE